MDHKTLHEIIKNINNNQRLSNDEKITRSMAAIHESNPAYYWVGVYLLDNDTLKLGPFSGPATDHIEIPVGRGICGSAVMSQKDMNVVDVSKVENYLACNIYTKSELVSLVRNTTGEIIGQIDIDATELNAFSEDDVDEFHELGKLLTPAMENLKKEIAI